MLNNAHGEQETYQPNLPVAVWTMILAASETRSNQGESTPMAPPDHPASGGADTSQLPPEFHIVESYFLLPRCGVAVRPKHDPPFKRNAWD